MRLNDLHPAPGTTHRRKRIGRGPSSGTGATSTKGHKGQKARSGGNVRPGFEGGQTPLYRRLPQTSGFRNINRKVFTVVNVSELEQFDAGTEITPDVLLEKAIIGKFRDGVKILGNGDLTKSFTVKANKFSKTAEEKIKAAGGTVEVL